MLGFQPGPEPPFGLLERLHALNRRLGLLWFGSVHRWGVTFDWSADDPRRARIQAGEIDPRRAFDLVGMLPDDCPLDQVAGWLERELRTHPNKDAVRALVADVDAHNARQRHEVLRPTLELAEELIATNAKTLFSAEGKHLPRTPAPRSTSNRDAKRLRDFFHDTNS